MMKIRNESPLIMVADRDEMERAQLRAVLKLKGFRVLEAANAPELLELAMQHRPDLLLLDLKLPRLRSSEALWLIRREPCLRKMPIIAVSNHDGKKPSNSFRSVDGACQPADRIRASRLYLNQFLHQLERFARNRERAAPGPIGIFGLIASRRRAVIG